MYLKIRPYGPATLFLLGLAVAPVVSAQATDTSQIENIVVEATRLNQTLHEVGGTVHVIDGQDIEAAGYDFLVDALAAAPGVTINQNGTFGGAASVRIRGASSDQTMVLIDGVQVNDTSSPGGAFNFARIDPANIERIEILSGPQSTLWGSDAIGGVVSIVTKRPVEQLAADAFVEYGSEATARAGFALSGAADQGSFRVGVSTINSDGISKADENNGNSEDDAYDSVSVSAQGQLNLPRGMSLQLRAHHNTAEAEFDSFSFGAQGNVGDGDELSDTEELSGQLQLEIPTLDDRLNHTLSVSYADITRDNFTNGAFSFGAEGERQTYRYLGQYQVNDNNTLAFGIEREETESGTNDNTIQSYFGLYEVNPTDNLTLTFGLRSDDVEDSDTETTGRLALAYQLTPNMTLRGSWGQGFKAPTLFQRTFFCCGATGPNLDLQAEESDAFDIGLNWRAASGSTSVSATYFNQETENQINFSFAAGGYENIDRVESQGVELGMSHQFNEQLSVDITYAYIDAEDDNGDPLIRIPEQTGDVRFIYQANERWSVSALVRYNDEEPDSNGNVDAWVRADLSAFYQFNEAIELFGRLENVAGAEYQQVLGYGTPDRAFSLGVRARL